MLCLLERDILTHDTLYKESSFWYIFCSEYSVMYRVQKSSNSNCVVPSSEPLGLNNIYG